MQRGFERIALTCDLGEVKTGREMRAFAGEDDAANVSRQSGEEGLEPEHRTVVESIALLRARQPEMGDRPEASSPSTTSAGRYRSALLLSPSPSLPPLIDVALDVIARSGATKQSREFVGCPSFTWIASFRSQ